MNRKNISLLFFACSLALSISACGIMPFGKTAKDSGPSTPTQTSKVEWGERKWEEYGRDGNGVVHYLDKSSISYPSKHIIHVWRKRVFPERIEGARKVKSSHKAIISYDEVNCTTEKYRALETQGINWDDTTTKIFTTPTPWTPVFENTADELLLQDYCKEAQKAPGL